MTMFKVRTPPIKSQGIKTKLVPWISTLLPPDFRGRWIEPFAGTGVVAFNLAPADALLADTNPHLVNFYNGLAAGLIDSAIVEDYLVREGEALRTIGEAHYYYVRDRFNDLGDPLDFLFINRAGFNGMIRFNKKGGFNIPFCRKPNRFARAYITKIVNQTKWIETKISERNFKFVCQDFSETIASAQFGDIIYCDPPYIDRHVDYYNGWNEDSELRLAAALKSSGASFILSTWHHNDFRTNVYIDKLWTPYHVLTREHFYHVGAKEENRNPMVEALVTDLPQGRQSFGSGQVGENVKQPVGEAA